MATNALDVFKLTMATIDELNDSGAADTSDTREYKNRTLQILNELQGELYPYSDAYEPADPGKRAISIPIINFEEPIVSLDDYICRTVLPCGLAAHLLLDENPSVASFFMQRYEDLKRDLAKGIAAVSEDIVDVYSNGRFEHCEYGYW